MQARRSWRHETLLSQLPRESRNPNRRRRGLGRPTYGVPPNIVQPTRRHLPATCINRVGRAVCEMGFPCRIRRPCHLARATSSRATAAANRSLAKSVRSRDRRTAWRTDSNWRPPAALLPPDISRPQSATGLHHTSKYAFSSAIPAPPPAHTLRSGVAELITTGTDHTRKALIETLIGEVKITGPDTVVPVFRIPRTPTDPTPTPAPHATARAPHAIATRNKTAALTSEKPPVRAAEKKCSRNDKLGGAKGNRTPDLLDANETRYQLRHSPMARFRANGGEL